MLARKTLVPAIHVNVLRLIEPTETLFDKVHPLLSTALPNGRGPTSRTMRPDPTKIPSRNGSRNMTKSPRLDLASKLLRSLSNHTFVGCNGTMDRTEVPSHKTLRTAPNVPVSGPCPGRSELFWQHERDLHNISQVVLMFCRIGIYCYPNLL